MDPVSSLLLLKKYLMLNVHIYHVYVIYVYVYVYICTYVYAMVTVEHPHNRPSESPTKDNVCIYIDQFFVPNRIMTKQF